MTDTQPRKRARRGERRKLILEGAYKIFADQGFSASTRDIAGALGVTQALLYKYFPSKDALIEAVFETQGSAEDALPDPAILFQKGDPLDLRVAKFYTAFIAGMEEDALRLCIRAALDGYAAHNAYASELLRASILPLVEALRAELSLPALGERALSQSEYELALSLHGSAVFIAMRQHIYQRGHGLPASEAMGNQVRLWTPGALSEMTRIHQDWDDQLELDRDALQSDDAVQVKKAG